MPNDLYYIEEGYLIKSSDIKVFPSAYRNTNIDPESRLYTEFNLTHQNTITNLTKSYIIEFTHAENAYTFSVILGGYYFNVTLPELPAVSSITGLYLYINKVDRVLHQINNVNINTKPD